MKKLLALLLSVTVLLALAGCGKEPESTTAPPDTTVTTAPDVTTVPVTTAPVVVRENKLVYGSTSEVSGDFTGGLVEVRPGFYGWFQYNIDFEANKKILWEIFRRRD